MARRLFPIAAAAALVIHAWPGPAEAGDAEAGRKAFDACVACHELGDGAKHGIGPHLNGRVGRAAASHADFDYSGSFLRLRDAGHVWSAAALDAFLRNPDAVAADSRMRFDGLPDARARADLIAFLGRAGDGAGMALLSPDAERGVDPAVLAILAIPGDREYGAWLSSECTTCHRADGADNGIPSIVHWPEADFVIAMHDYRSKRRAHPLMQTIAARLGDEEIAALAAYFAKPAE